jgi:hypothetical protein
MRNTHPEEKYTVRTLKPEELYAIWQFDEVAYGEDNIDYDLLKSWYDAYPQGFPSIFNNNLLSDDIENYIGGIGVFPVTYDFYQSMYHKELDENALTADIIRQALIEHADHSKKDFWYLSGINIREGHRHSMALMYLLENTKKKIFGLDHKNSNHLNVSYCAYASTKEGKKLLNRMNFLSSPHDPSFYTYSNHHGTNDK